MASRNRRKKNLTIEEKVALLRRLESGAKNKDVAAEFDVVHSTICYIVRNKETIYKQHKILLAHDGDKNRTKLSRVEETPLEKAIYQWYKQKRKLGEPISGSMLKKQALEFCEILGGASDFRASDGWLTRFKNRHGIRNPLKKSRKLSSEKIESKLSPDTFSNYLKHHIFDMNNVYNVSETVILWKSLPSSNIMTAANNINRVTMLICVNATGTHKIPLFIVGKLNSSYFRNVVRIPVIYRASTNGLIDNTLFEDWFTTIFLPQVKERNKNIGDKFLLLLQTKEHFCYPPAERINAIDPSCTVFFLSVNPTEANQPLDQGIIQDMKTEYRKNFLLDILMQDLECIENVTTYIHQWSIMDFCRIIAISWESISVLCITNAWKKVLSDVSYFDNDNEYLTDVAVVLQKVPGYEHVTIEELLEWIQRDNTLPTWKQVKDEEISELHNCLLDDSVIKTEENVDVPAKMDEENILVPTAQEAFAAIKTLYEWCETQWKYEEEDFCNLRHIHRVATNIVMEQIHTDLYNKM